MTDIHARRLRATLIGGTAVLMWGLLALLTTLTGRVPPFQLTAMAFAVATALVAVKWVVAGDDVKTLLTQPRGAWLLGVSGLFGYHFFMGLYATRRPWKPVSSPTCGRC